MSSPFPSELVAAKQGSRVAWVFDAKGVSQCLGRRRAGLYSQRKAGDALHRGRWPAHCQLATHGGGENWALRFGQRT